MIGMSLPSYSLLMVLASFFLGCGDWAWPWISIFPGTFRLMILLDLEDLWLCSSLLAVSFFWGPCELFGLIGLELPSGEAAGGLVTLLLGLACCFGSFLFSLRADWSYARPSYFSFGFLWLCMAEALVCGSALVVSFLSFASRGLWLGLRLLELSLETFGLCFFTFAIASRFLSCCSMASSFEISSWSTSLKASF